MLLIVVILSAISFLLSLACAALLVELRWQKKWMSQANESVEIYGRVAEKALDRNVELSKSVAELGVSIERDKEGMIEAALRAMNSLGQLVGGKNVSQNEGE